MAYYQAGDIYYQPRDIPARGRSICPSGTVQHVKICLDQPIALSVDDAQSAFLDPGFYRTLGELGGISAPEVRSFSKNHDVVRTVLGYRFSGELNGVARKILDPEKLTWSQVTEVDLITHRNEVEMVPDNYAALLSFSGWYELCATGEGLCSQHFEADLRVHLPLLGPIAEHAIAGSIRQNVADTARLIERYVASQRAGSGPAATPEEAEPPPGTKAGSTKAGSTKAGGTKIGGTKAAGG